MTKSQTEGKKVVAYVIKKAGKTWDMVCQTEYLEDGTWVMGMNLITSIGDVLDRAEKQGLNIFFESMLEGKNE